MASIYRSRSAPPGMPICQPSRQRSSRRKDKGVTTSASLVSNIVSQYRKKLGLKGKRRRRRQVAVAQPDSTATADATAGSICNVIEAVKLVSKARELVGAEGLREIVKAM